MVQNENDLSTEALLNRAYTPSQAQTVPAGSRMVGWQQYGTSTAISNSTAETSVFNLSKISAGVTSGSVYITPSTLFLIPANYMAPGLNISSRLYGSIANTGTPTLRVRFVLKNPSTGSIVYTLADTTAVAMTTVTTSDFEIGFDSSVAAIGATTGSVLGRAHYRYAGTIVSIAFATTTVDTTAAYQLDALLTWGAASSSNTMTLAFGNVELS